MGRQNLEGSLVYGKVHGIVWPNVKKQFSRQIVRADIVKKMIECGMRISDDLKLYVDDVEVDYTAMVRAVGVDRRVVKQTVKQIRGNAFLYGIFSRTMPFGTSLVNVVARLRLVYPHSEGVTRLR